MYNAIFGNLKISITLHFGCALVKNNDNHNIVKSHSSSLGDQFPLRTKFAIGR